VIIGSVLKNHGGNMLEAGFFFCVCCKKFEGLLLLTRHRTYAHDWGHNLYSPRYRQTFYCTRKESDMSRTLIRKAEVVRRTALSESTIRRLVDKGTFPQPVQLTDTGSIAWFQDEVDGWIESRQILTPELQRKVAPGTTKGVHHVGR